MGKNYLYGGCVPKEKSSRLLVYGGHRSNTHTSSEPRQTWRLNPRLTCHPTISMVGTTIQSHHLPQYRGAQRLASKKQRIPGILPVDQALPYTWASTDKSIYQANHPSCAQCSIHSRYLWIKQASMSRCTNLTIRLISQNQEQALSICTASSEGQEASNEPSRLKSKDAAKKRRKKQTH
ncbi:hypothetical protein BJV82DRAFT_315528 [Fennellomyces sp. T-0311]|nr:hypothetical protein BJV82DRAFT_315528 [Fennellomyces sp. T-0311]